VLSVIVLLLAAVTLFPAGNSVVTLAGAEAWAYIGPHLVLASVLAVALSVPIALRHPRTRPASAVAVVSIAALVAASAITTAMVVATYRNGGSVNAFEALALGYPSRPDRTATYAVADGQQLTALVYTPKDSAAGAPVLMYIHGGGWISGSANANGGVISRWFADQGWFVVNVNYRLATEDDATWNKAPADVACALTWTARQARAAGGDVKRLVVMGDSAGGNLAINLGWSTAASKATSTCPSRGDVPAVRAVVVVNPVANPGYTYEHGRPWFGQDPRDFITDYLGGTPSEHPDRLAAISAQTYISRRAPPTLIVQSPRDDFVPAQGNYEVADRARASGADVTIVRIPFTYHAFSSLAGSLGFQIDVSVSENWLEERNLAPAR
jgi:acetyl esterase